MTTTKRINPAHQLFRDLVCAERRLAAAADEATRRRWDSEVRGANNALLIAYFGGLGNPRREDDGLWREFAEAVATARASY
jgi:hypothetical protein